MKKHPLYKILKASESREAFEKVLKVILTEKEEEMIRERLRIFEALDRGLSQREVAKEIGCSVVTVTRGAKAYRDNKKTVKQFLNILQSE